VMDRSARELRTQTRVKVDEEGTARVMYF